MPELDIAAVIPARGGSRSIPLKNIVEIGGRPLLSYTIRAAMDAQVARGVFVSTDSPRIAEVARNHGADVIDRPADLAGDTASTESALIHAVEVIESRHGSRPDAILTLPATSPLRGPGTIRRCVHEFIARQPEIDALLTFNECRGDYWMREPDGRFSRLFPNAPRRRQDREPIYLENSAVYLTRTDALLQTHSVLGTACAGIVIDNVEAIDINVPLDVQWVEFLMTQRGPECRGKARQI